MRIILKLFICFIVSLYLTLYNTKSETTKIPLRVALFPYLPDTIGDNFSAFMKRIKSEFENENDDIALDLRALN